MSVTFSDADEITDEQWLAYLWWRDWDHLWGQIGLAEEQWATLYSPFMRRQLSDPAGSVDL